MTTNPLPRRALLSGSLAAAAIGVTSCTFSSSDEPQAEGDKAKADSKSSQSSQPSKSLKFRQMTRPIDHLDPAFNGSTVPDTAWLTAGLMEGLVLLDPKQGDKVLPGVAKKWDTSDDGLTYTFHLRDEAKWSNGDPVTADDFVWNWKRSLSPDTAKEQENDLSFGGDIYQNVKGAPKFFAGKTKDFSTVGVKAKDKHTLEFTLIEPDPLFLPALARQNTRPLHPKTVEKHPKKWSDPKYWVSNGPYVLKKWRANSGCTAVRNDHYWDKDNYPIETWESVFNDGGDTAGMVKYNADEIEVFRVNGDPASILSEKKVADQLHLAPMTQFNCLSLMNSENPVLESDIRIRQALSMAIDRDAIAKIAKPLKAATTLCPSGIPGYDKIDAATKFDPDKAKKLLADAGHAGGKGIPKINLLIYSKMPWIEAVGEMWHKHLGIKYKVDQVDVGVLSDKTNQVHPKDYVGFRYYHYGIKTPTMYGYVNMLPGSANAMPTAACKKYWKIDNDKELSGSQKKKKKEQLTRENWWSSYKKYADLVDKAKVAAADPDKSQELAIQAASALEKTYVHIPILWSGYTFMIKPSVKNLKITSYMDLLYNLKGVTVEK